MKNKITGKKRLEQSQNFLGLAFSLLPDYKQQEQAFFETVRDLHEIPSKEEQYKITLEECLSRFISISVDGIKIKIQVENQDEMTAVNDDPQQLTPKFSGTYGNVIFELDTNGNLIGLYDANLDDENLRFQVPLLVAQEQFHQLEDHNQKSTVIEHLVALFLKHINHSYANQTELQNQFLKTAPLVKSGFMPDHNSEDERNDMDQTPTFS